MVLSGPAGASHSSPGRAAAGDADQVTPLAQSQRYVAKATQLGDPATLITLPGTDHPNTNPVRVGEPLWTQTKSQLQTLLGR